jgi:hypothetical protein
MKSCIGLFFLLFISVPALASDGEAGRDFQLFLAFGPGKSSTTAENTGGKSNFEGWSPSAELGLEIPWSSRSGITASAEYKLINLTNTTASTTLIENAEGNSQAAKLGLFFDHWTLGGGISQEALTFKQVSTVTGAAETKLTGSSSLTYINYIIHAKPYGRITFEGQHRTGVLSNVTVTDLSVFMKFSLMLAF